MRTHSLVELRYQVEVRDHQWDRYLLCGVGIDQTRGTVPFWNRLFESADHQYITQNEVNPVQHRQGQVFVTLIGSDIRDHKRCILTIGGMQIRSEYGHDYIMQSHTYWLWNNRTGRCQFMGYCT